MNFKATFLIVSGLVSAIFIVVVILTLYSQGRCHDIEIFEPVNNSKDNLEVSTFAGIASSGVIDAPLAPLSCNKGMRYDDVSNKCKRIIREAKQKKRV